MSEATQLIDYESYLKQQAAAMRARLNKPKLPKISLAGKRFTLPNGESSPGPMNVIILQFAFITRYYEAQYQQGQHEEPDCMAVSMDEDTMAPLDTVKNKQHTDCKTCPKNQFGSRGKGKICRNGIRLAVVSPQYTDGHNEILLIEASATAIGRWDGYANMMAARYGIPAGANITELDFDPNMSVPSLVFRDKGGIKGDNELMQLIQSAPDVLLIEAN